MILGYGRLSRDEDKENYCSIISQKEIITNYAKNHNLDHQNILFFEDDNVSGYKFSRPGLNELLNYIYESKEQCIILVKDLSRIGRHNARVLLLLEEIKSLKHKLIAIDDNIDSDDKDSDFIGIKTWVNERYVTDCSKRTRSNLYSQMRANTYTNALPYGYLKDEITKTIIIDKEIEPVIKRIFEMYMSGLGVWKIANTLNQENIDAPAEHFRKLAEQKGKVYKKLTRNKWTDHMILNMLRNDFYIGIKRLKKTVRDGIHGKRLFNNEEDQIVFKDNHEAIIDKKDFYLIQDIIEKRKVLNYRGSVKHNNPFSSFLICADCNAVMIARSQVGRQKCYICSSYKRYGKTTCESHHIREDDLTKKIHEIIYDIKLKIEDYLSSIQVKNMEKIETEQNYNMIIKKTNSEIFNLKQQHKILINQKIKTIINNPDMEETIEKQYQELEKDLFQKIEILEKQIIQFNELKEKSQQLDDNIKTAYEVVDLILESKTINKKYLELFIEKIIVYNNKDLEVQLKGNLDSLFISHRRLDSEQVHIIFINAISYLAQIYEILKVKQVY